MYSCRACSDPSNYLVGRLPLNPVEEHRSIGTHISDNACFISIATCFYNVLHHFGIIYWTNLLTRCPVPVSIYYVCALQKRSKIQSARKISKKLQIFFFARRLWEPEGQVQGRPTASRCHPGGWTWGGGRVPPGWLVHPLAPPLRLYICS